MLNEKDTLLLWRYADGDCTEAEAGSIRDRLQREPGLRQAWDEIQVLQANLQAVEADQPSLRFTRNVLDQLPPATQRLEKIRLLPSAVIWRWATGIGLAIVASVMMLPTGTVNAPSAVGGLLEPMEGKVLESVSLWESLPQTWILTGSLALILILGLDQILKARLRNRHA